MSDVVDWPCQSRMGSNYGLVGHTGRARCSYPHMPQLARGVSAVPRRVRHIRALLDEARSNKSSLQCTTPGHARPPRSAGCVLEDNLQACKSGTEFVQGRKVSSAEAL